LFIVLKVKRVAVVCDINIERHDGLLHILWISVLNPFFTLDFNLLSKYLAHYSNSEVTRARSDFTGNQQP